MHSLIYSFDPEKNKSLIETRGISFEEVISAMEGKGLLDVIEHPNETRYSNQKIYVVELRNYVYLVPFVESEEHLFLKTIIPSRKATRLYLKATKKEKPDG